MIKVVSTDAREKAERKSGHEVTRHKAKYHHERNQHSNSIEYLLDEWRNKYVAYQYHNGYRIIAVLLQSKKI
ncbi:hypothetical protein BUZ94_02930 [Mammaliicoccus sciuri]|uniref:hypothetical protein n=1 Tax=Mammaliicoccus sciuri TaxID=1296 RepID=UPI000E68AB28|nr:hypothetical protein [Mammaliicoccus sciuri]RIO11039.1 hypothetical protein BUZ94_02930 [Mammaliicoccus sciuri]